MPTMSYVTNGIWASNLVPNGVIREYKRDTYIRSAVVKRPEHALKATHPGIFVPPTPMSNSRTLTQANKGEYADKFGGWGVGVSTDEYYPPSSAPSFSTLSQKALVTALLKLKDQDINLSVAFGERAQTANLVASSIKRIAGCIKGLRKKDPAAAMRALGLKGNPKGIRGTVQQMWLELQYGWKPLLSDVHGAMEALAKADSAQPDRYRVTVKGLQKANTRWMNSTVAQGDISWLIRQMSEQGVYVRLDYKMDNPLLAQAANLGLTNPAALAWELVPFSFVADWFVPVGDYLNCLDAALGYSFLGGSKTERWMHHSKTEAGWRTGAVLNNLKYWRFSGAEKIVKTVVRTVYSSSPLPRHPGFKNPFSATHVANALALLGQVVK